jgi:hypothetical protein
MRDRIQHLGGDTVCAADGGERQVQAQAASPSELASSWAVRCLSHGGHPHRAQRVIKDRHRERRRASLTVALFD